MNKGAVKLFNSPSMFNMTGKSPSENKFADDLTSNDSLFLKMVSIFVSKESIIDL
jgi:hypothetical protein